MGSIMKTLLEEMQEYRTIINEAVCPTCKGTGKVGPAGKKQLVKKPTAKKPTVAPAPGFGPNLKDDVARLKSLAKNTIQKWANNEDPNMVKWAKMMPVII